MSGTDLSIQKIANNDKDLIEQPALSKLDVIPRLNSSSLLIGPSGSGKSTLLTRLITDERFFKGFFDSVVVISPTASSDKVQKELGASVTLTDMVKAARVLPKILKMQSKKVKKQGFVKAPKIALIYDDIIGESKFMNLPVFTKSFIANRHYNITTFLCSQSYKSVPRKCRLQASNVFFFKSSASEVQRISDEYAPPGYTKQEMRQIVDYAVGNGSGTRTYDFLHINMKRDFADRYRKNLDTIMRLTKNV